MRPTNLYLLLILICLSACLRAETATLCMAAVTTPAGAEVAGPLMSPANDYVAPAPLRIVIGKRAAEVDSEQGALLTLPSKPRCLVEIWQHKKRKLSFWLRFSDYGSNALCLWHKPFYGSISVIEASDPRCKCVGPRRDKSAVSLARQTIVLGMLEARN